MNEKAAEGQNQTPGFIRYKPNIFQIKYLEVPQSIKISIETKDESIHA
jgi:hypothetical protein